MCIQSYSLGLPKTETLPWPLTPGIREIFLCRNYVLNGLQDSLYNIYCGIKTSKELWESLEKKYKTEDAGTKKFVVAKFLEYVMKDNKTVISQVQEFQIILHEIEAEGMMLSESFQVAAMIEKLPPRWRDFKNYLKHKRKEMTLEDLILRLRIEEDNKKSDGKTASRDFEERANIVEGSKKFSGMKRKNPGSSSKAKEPETKKFSGKCFNCQKTGTGQLNVGLRRSHIKLTWLWLIT